MPKSSSNATSASAISQLLANPTDVDMYSDSGVSASGVRAVPKEPSGKITGYISVAGKTGTAENSGGADHAWFVAFAPADDPKIAVAVLLENAGKGSKAIPVARNVMKYYLENCYE